MAEDEPRDPPRDEGQWWGTGSGAQAAKDASTAPEELDRLVAAMEDLAALQSSSFTVVEMLAEALGDLMIASAALHESVIELQTWAADVSRGAAGATPVGEPGAHGQGSLRGQANQLAHHGDELQQHAKKLCERAESLSANASKLMGESRRIAGRRE